LLFCLDEATRSVTEGVSPTASRNANSAQAARRRASPNSSIIFAQKAGRSSGLRLVTVKSMSYNIGAKAVATTADGSIG
jgi:hypothetical protein